MCLYFNKRWHYTYIQYLHWSIITSKNASLILASLWRLSFASCLEGLNFSGMWRRRSALTVWHLRRASSHTQSNKTWNIHRATCSNQQCAAEVWTWCTVNRAAFGGFLAANHYRTQPSVGDKNHTSLSFLWPHISFIWSFSRLSNITPNPS